MKKNYIQPEILGTIRYSLETPLCGSNDKASWGNKTSKYGNSNWFNEPLIESEAVDIGEDNGEINSQTKGRGGDWGSIW